MGSLAIDPRDVAVMYREPFVQVGHAIPTLSPRKLQCTAGFSRAQTAPPSARLDLIGEDARPTYTKEMDRIAVAPSS